MIKILSNNRMLQRLIRKGLFFIGIISFAPIYSQNNTQLPLLLPVDIPVKLAANFGELRPNHFHGGIDFKTMQVVGKNMIAIDTGYVSRVQIRSAGYGLALYVTHPSGLTSVYGHLLSLSPEIDSAVKKFQYDNQVNMVDASFKPGELPVRRGDVIALSGNSGSSTGPHLHFEIRDTKTNTLINPLQFYPQIKDNVRPKISNICVYPIDSGSYINNAKTKLFSKVVAQPNNPGMYKVLTPINIWGNIGFSINGNDYTPTPGHVFGYYSVALQCNDTLLYERKIDEIELETNADINSLIDFKEKLATGRLFEKAFLDPNNELKIYTRLHNRGVFQAIYEDSVMCEFIVSDYSGNIAAVTIPIVITNVPDSVKKTVKKQPQKLSCKEAVEIKVDECTLTASNKTFYTDYTLKMVKDTLAIGKRYYSKKYTITTDQLVLKKPMKIAIQSKLPPELYSKALIENSSKSGGKSAVLAKVSETGLVEASIKRVGTFAVVIDTVAPVITPKFVNNQNMSALKKLGFKMGDNFSGIKKFDAFVDSTWCILEYDAKQGIVYLPFDETRIVRGKTHTLVIRLEDMCGNIREKQYSFVW